MQYIGGCGNHSGAWLGGSFSLMMKRMKIIVRRTLASLHHCAKDKQNKRGSVGDMFLQGDVCLPARLTAHTEAAADDEVEDYDKLLAVSDLLVRGGRKVLTDQELLSNKLCLSRRSLMRYMSATAEASHKLQEELLRRILQYCSQVQRSWQPLLFVHGLKFDETPIRLIGKLQGQEAENMLNKVFVIETTWRILLKKPGGNGGADEFMLLHGTLSPQCRFGENTTAGTVADLLSTCWEPPPTASIFKHKWRVLETDAAAANMKAERVKMATLSVQNWRSLHGHCVAHRVHTVAARLFDCPGSTQHVIKGCIRSLLVLQAPGALRKFKAAVLDLCIDQPVNVVVNDDLMPEALQYREKVLSLFLPNHERSRARATVDMISEKLLNGDWRSPIVQHHCQQGCCSSLSQTSESFKIWLPKLISALRLHKFSRANWAQWAEALNLIGYLSLVHGLFRRAFLKAFEKIVENPSEVDAFKPADSGDILAAAGSSDDKIAIWRQEMSQHLRIALAWWSTEEPEWHLYLLRTVLEPERLLMNELLQITATGWQLKEMQQRRQTGVQSMQLNHKLIALQS
eukprot:6492784-Amphidinium_carterae.2